MKTSSIIALVLLASSIGLPAAPALAAGASMVPMCNGGSNPDIDINPDVYIGLLKEQGVNVTDISQWGGCIRAFVTDSSGHSVIVFFDADTMKQVGGPPVGTSR